MNMKKILLLITLFTCALMPAMAKDYVDDLYVTVDGNTSGPFENSKVTVTDNGDGTIKFALNNFVLVTDDGDETPVGNISIENIATTKADGVTSFFFEGIITIEDGDDPEVDTWAGPWLGELPTKLSGKMVDEALYVDIYIDASGTLGQVIQVKFGKEEKVTAVEKLAPVQTKSGVIYDLTGKKVVNPLKGKIYIQNGKKVIK